MPNATTQMTAADQLARELAVLNIGIGAFGILGLLLFGWLFFHITRKPK